MPARWMETSSRKRKRKAIPDADKKWQGMNRLVRMGGANAKTNACIDTDATILRSAGPAGTHNTGDVRLPRRASGAREVLGAKTRSCPVRL